MDVKYSFNRTAFGNPINIAVFVAVILVIFLALFGQFWLSQNWGFNSLDIVPGYLYYIWLVLLIGIIALYLISPARHYLSVFLEEYFWGEKKKIGRLATAGVALVIALVFRFEAHLFGEGYLDISNFAQRAQPIIQWHEFGVTVIPYSLYWLLNTIGLEKIDAAAWSYKSLSFISGLVYINYTFRIADKISDDVDDKIAFLFLTWFSGISLLFFGFIGETPILIALAVVFIDLLIDLSRARNRKKMLFIWLVSIIGIILDLLFISVLPALTYITFKAIFKRHQIGRFIGSVAAYIVIIAGIVVLYLMAVGNLGLSKYILFPEGKSPETYYGLFSLSHLIDMLNLLYMFTPVFLILILAVILRLRFIKKDTVLASLGFLTLTQVIMAFIIDPRNGMARDFHTFFFLMTGFFFLGIYAILQLKRNAHLSKDSFMALSPTSFLLILPMFMVHLYFPFTEKYLDDYLEKNDFKYEAALYAFRDYHILKEQFEQATAREQSIRSKAPGVLESNLINDLYAHGRVDDAMEYALRLTERFPYNAKYHLQKANLLKHYRRYGEAEIEYRIAITLEPHQPENYRFLAELYRAMGRETSGLAVIQNGLAIEPDNTFLLIDLAGHYFRTGKDRQTDSVCNVIEGIDPEIPYIYMYRGLLAERSGRPEQAMQLYEKFVGMNERLPEVGLIRKRINDIYLQLNDTTGQN
jgi:tetratricopeptide (TPR) repeat protein